MPRTLADFDYDWVKTTNPGKIVKPHPGREPPEEGGAYGSTLHGSRLRPNTLHGVTLGTSEQGAHVVATQVT